MKKFLSNMGFILRGGIFIAAVGFVANFYRMATDNFQKPNGRDKVEDVSMPKDSLKDVDICDLTEKVKYHYHDITMAYNSRVGKFHLDAEHIDKVVADTVSYEVLLEGRNDKSGFYGVAVRNCENNMVSLCFAGANFGFDNWNDIKGLVVDLDDIMTIPTGQKLGQTKDMIKFCNDFSNKFGEPDIIVGHSLGSYLAQYAVGANLFDKDIPAILYDGPGDIENSVENMAEMSNSTTEEVTRRLRDNTISVMISANCLNSLGEQSGIKLTLSDVFESQELPWNLQNAPKKILHSFFPENHINNTDFIKGMMRAEEFIVTNDGKEHQSHAPLVVSLLALGLGVAAISPDIYRKLKGKGGEPSNRIEIKDVASNTVDNLVNPPCRF